MDLISKLASYKTYIVAFVGAGLALAQAFNPELSLPEWLNTVLGFMGLAALRAGVAVDAAKP